MSRWFRFYDDAINDPKILKLSDKLHRVWIGILCVASKNDGKLPSLEDMALMIRMKPEKLDEAVKELITAGLIDEEGPILFPHNWNARQFKSDVSTDRVKRFRNGKRNVSETAPDTDTDTDTDTEKKDAAPTGAQIVPLINPEKVFFDQAHDICGRPLAAKLLKAKNNNVALAHSALLAASTKSNPREYLGAIIRGREGEECRPDRSF